MQKLEDVVSEEDTRAKGFKSGDSYKRLERDFILLTEQEAKAAREQVAKEAGAKI